jgi:hypothetical protein
MSDTKTTLEMIRYANKLTGENLCNLETDFNDLQQEMKDKNMRIRDLRESEKFWMAQARREEINADFSLLMMILIGVLGTWSTVYFALLRDL